MRSFWRAIAILSAIAALASAAIGTSPGTATARRHAAASPAPSGSPRPAGSPTPAPSPSLSPGATPPTPFMPLDQIPNGKWLIIEQPAGLPVYSSMILTDVGTTISGEWHHEKDVYYVTGTRQGSKMTLDLKASKDPNAAAVGKIAATLDGIADMFGMITLNGKDTPFQGAQHARVPPPVEPAAEASPSPGPF